jgi:hypothetical protein
VGRFGTIKKLEVLEHAKNSGANEKETVAFLTYDRVESHWFAIARFNDVLVVNDVACCFRPASLVNRINDRANFEVHCNYRVEKNDWPRNLYVEKYADCGYKWCCMCCLFGRKEEMMSIGRSVMVWVAHNWSPEKPYSGCLDRRGVMIKQRK